MRILTLLPATSVERVSLALGKTVLVETVSQGRQFLDLAQTAIWRMLVIDPDLIAHQEESAFLDRVGYCSAPLVVYTSLTRASARTIATLARRSLAAVILRGFDDSLASLRSILDPVRFESLGGSRIQAAPADAVEVRLNRTVGRIAGMGISIGGTEAINAKGEHALTSVSIEVGAGLSRTSTGRGLPVSGSVKIPDLDSCFGSICR